MIVRVRRLCWLTLALLAIAAAAPAAAQNTEEACAALVKVLRLLGFVPDQAETVVLEPMPALARDARG